MTFGPAWVLQILIVSTVLQMSFFPAIIAKTNCNNMNAWLLWTLRNNSVKSTSNFFLSLDKFLVKPIYNVDFSDKVDLTEYLSKDAR